MGEMSRERFSVYVYSGNKLLDKLERCTFGAACIAVDAARDYFEAPYRIYAFDTVTGEVILQEEVEK